MEHPNDFKDNVAKRKHTRFRPDVPSLAWIQFDIRDTSFKADTHAIVYEEAFGGCCLILMAEKALTLGMRWNVKVGDLEPMGAEIVWCKNLDLDVWKIGLKFLDS